jgi:capsular exopolysaccharide synthesis family protein
MQPKPRRPKGSSSANSDYIDGADVERFLATGGTVEQIALAFGIDATMARASLRRAAEAALNARARPSVTARRPTVTPPSGWFDAAPIDPRPQPRPDEPADPEGSPVTAHPTYQDARTPARHDETEMAPSPQLLEWAMRSAANGTPLANAANWFGVPDSELRAWLNDAGVALPDNEHEETEPTREPETPATPASAEPWVVSDASRLRIPAFDGEERPADEPGVGAEGRDEPPIPAPSVVPGTAPEAVVAQRHDPETTDAPDLSPMTTSKPPRATDRPGRTEPDRAVRRSPSPRRNPTAYAPNRPSVTERRSSSDSPITLRDALHVLRRRLPVVVVLLIVGAIGGWISAPGKTAGQISYRATHTVIYEPHSSQSYNIEQVALLATSGDVPSRVAARLKLDRATVRSAVSATANTDVSTIAITGRSTDSAMAVSLADVTADELNAEISGPDQAAYDARIKQLTGAVDAAQARLNAVPAKDAAGQAAARADLNAAQQSLAQYKSSTPPPDTQLVTLEKASATAVKPAGVKAPNSRTGRALLLGLFGLFVGIAGAVTLERMDSRIRSKSRAEDAFGAPVVAEVPPIAKSLQGRLLTRTDATSPFIEAYRGLRTYVALWAPELHEDDGHRVIVVTSPGAGEGKTTTVAHLAAMLAELGRSVVVISADLRRPRIHQYFDQPEGPGLVEALEGSDIPEFDKLERATSVRYVRLVPSGRPVNNPAPLLEHAAELVSATRPLADFVLIDCPPLLVANDAVEMARHADGVLLVSRAGKTPVEAAERSAELLERLDIPVVGTVLVGSEAVSNASRYYTARYYAEPDRSGFRHRRSAGRNGGGTVAEKTGASSAPGQ